MRLFMKRSSSDLRYSEMASFHSRVWRTFGDFIMSIALVSVSFGLMAQAISPQMMAQFQSMPLAQQQALVAQYGVDLDQIMGGGAALFGLFVLRHRRGARSPSRTRPPEQVRGLGRLSHFSLWA